MVCAWTDWKRRTPAMRKRREKMRLCKWTGFEKRNPAKKVRGSDAYRRIVTSSRLRVLARELLRPGPKLTARRLKMAGEVKKNPAREDMRADVPLCNGTSLVE